MKQEQDKGIKQDSIQVNRTMKGRYTWSIKQYHDLDTADASNIVTKISRIDNMLKDRYIGRNNDNETEQDTR